MRQCLEVRLAAAENEIRSAEVRKKLNEQCGKKCLTEEKLIMAQVVQESKNLRQQAEDNAKVVMHPFRIFLLPISTTCFEVFMRKLDMIMCYVSVN